MFQLSRHTGFSRCVLIALTAGAAIGAVSNRATAQCNGTWTHPFPAGPTARFYHAAAFDSDRGVIVLFGGMSGSLINPVFNNQTWEWDGVKWTNRTTSPSPSPRGSHAMAYDSVRKVVVLFGGLTSSNPTTGYNNETWTWNGTAWSKSLVTGPPPRASSGMVFDTARGVAVLFGGLTVGAVGIDDTWEWNGAIWTLKQPVTKPSARSGHAMSFDSRRGVTVLFGGTGPAASDDQTWEYNGSNWTQRIVTVRPSSRTTAAMTFDAGKGVSVLFGGTNSLISTANNETWEWNGTSWVQKFPSPAPDPRSGHSLTFDGARRENLLFGGILSNGTNSAETWLWRYPVLSITQQPMAQSIAAGADAILSVTASGGIPINYKWRRNGAELSDSGKLSGTTAAALAINNATSAEAGTYDVVLTNPCGSITSAQAVLTVGAGPAPPIGICGTGIGLMTSIALLFMTAIRRKRRKRLTQGILRH